MMIIQPSSTMMIGLGFLLPWLMIMKNGLLLVDAHVPYFEKVDYTEENPYVMEQFEKSIAVYSYLDSADDVDVFEFEVTDPSISDMVCEVIVPVCDGEVYKDFSPSLVLVGPGLPTDYTFTPPITVPAGEGAILLSTPASDRETFFEPFGGKKYYSGPRFEGPLDKGVFKVAIFDTEKKKGDYAAALGLLEIFDNLPDILRGFAGTIYVQKGLETVAKKC